MLLPPQKLLTMETQQMSLQHLSSKVLSSAVWNENNTEVATACTVIKVSRNKSAQQIISVLENHTILHICSLNMQERPLIQHQD